MRAGPVRDREALADLAQRGIAAGRSGDAAGAVVPNDHEFSSVSAREHGNACGRHPADHGPFPPGREGGVNELHRKVSTGHLSRDA